jgi:hypothetical protein
MSLYRRPLLTTNPVINNSKITLQASSESQTTRYVSLIPFSKSTTLLDLQKKQKKNKKQNVLQ